MADSKWCKQCDGAGELPVGRHVEKCVTCDGSGVAYRGPHAGEPEQFEPVPCPECSHSGKTLENQVNPLEAAEATGEPLTARDVDGGVVWCYDGERPATGLAGLPVGSCGLPPESDAACGCKPVTGELVTVAEAIRMCDEVRAGVTTEAEFILRDHYGKNDCPAHLMARIEKLRYRSTAGIGLEGDLGH